MWTIELTSAERAVLNVAMADFKDKYKSLAYLDEIESVMNKLKTPEWKK